jgi:hypothetical protein
MFRFQGPGRILLCLSFLLLAGTVALSVGSTTKATPIIPVFDLLISSSSTNPDSEVHGEFITRGDWTPSNSKVRLCTWDDPNFGMGNNWSCKDETVSNPSGDHFNWEFDTAVSTQSKGWVMVLLKSTNGDGVSETSYVASEYDTTHTMQFGSSHGVHPGSLVPITFSPTLWVTTDSRSGTANGRFKTWTPPGATAAANSSASHPNHVKYRDAPAGSPEEPGTWWSRNTLVDASTGDPTNGFVKFNLVTTNDHGIFFAQCKEVSVPAQHHLVIPRMYSGFIREY